MTSFLLILLTTTLVLAAPLALAALGGYTSERSGVVNIGLEGNMLASAVAAALVGAAMDSAWIGLLAGLGAAVSLSVAHWCLTQVYGIDAIISGMALNLLALGGSNFVHQKFADLSRSGELPVLSLGVLHLGPARLPLSLFLLLALALPFAIHAYSERTRAGLRLRAVGNDPDKARLMGVEPLKVRLWALLATGVLTGFAGVMLVSNVGRFTDNMSAGRGFIALAALILGGWRPIQSALACFAFASVEALQLQLQGTELFGASIPSEVWSSLPYLAAVVALAGSKGAQRAPLGLGKP